MQKMQRGKLVRNYVFAANVCYGQSSLIKFLKTNDTGNKFIRIQ